MSAQRSKDVPVAASSTAHAEIRVTYLVKQLERAIRTDMDAMTRELGLTALQYTALSVLRRHPGLSSAQMSRRSFVSPQAGSEMVAVLTRKELVSREPDVRNRRMLRIYLTAKGEDVLHCCDERMDLLQGRMLAELSPQDVRRFERVLVACVRALKPDSASREL